MKLLQLTQNVRRLIVNICEACEQFKKRVKEWNYWSGATDPLPYIDNMIKPHKHLIFEKRRVDGAGWIFFIFRCHKCEQRWELCTCSAVGQIDVKPYVPEYHLTL